MAVVVVAGNVVGIAAGYYYYFVDVNAAGIHFVLMILKLLPKIMVIIKIQYTQKIKSHNKFVTLKKRNCHVSCEMW